IQLGKPHVPQGRKLFFCELLVPVLVRLRQYLRCQHCARAKTTATAGTAEAWSAGSAERFVCVMWNDMKTPALVLVDIVVTGADPIAVIVDERIFEGEKLQSAVNIQQRLQRLL